jgi:hypothetical protein
VREDDERESADRTVPEVCLSQAMPFVGRMREPVLRRMQ